MNINRILISQPAPTTEKNPFNDIAIKHNVKIDFMPIINIQPVELKELRAQRIDILKHDAIIFTSKNAIDYFFTLTTEDRVVIPETMKYFCTTETIALYLQKYIVYRKRKINFAQNSFQSLVELIAKHKELKFIFPLNDSHKEEQITALTNNGINFSKLIVSHTVPADLSNVNLDDYQIVALYSPAEVKTLAKQFDLKSDKTKIATFGTLTAREIFDTALTTVDIAAPSPKFPSIVTAIDKFLIAHNKNEDVEEFALRTAPELPQINCVNKTRKTRVTK